MKSSKTQHPENEHVSRHGLSSSATVRLLQICEAPEMIIHF